MRSGESHFILLIWLLRIITPVWYICCFPLALYLCVPMARPRFENRQFSIVTFRFGVLSIFDHALLKPCVVLSGVSRLIASFTISEPFFTFLKEQFDTLTFCEASISIKCAPFILEKEILSTVTLLLCPMTMPIAYFIYFKFSDTFPLPTKCIFFSP